MKEIFVTLSKTYVCTDRYLEEILVPIRKMRPVDENDHVGLETFYVHILALCNEARALNLFHHVANPLVTAMSMTEKGSFTGLTARRQTSPPLVSQSALQEMRPSV